MGVICGSGVGGAVRDVVASVEDSEIGRAIEVPERFCATAGDGAFSSGMPTK